MNLFVADVGQGKVHIYDSNRDIAYLKLPQEHLINLDIEGLESGDVIVIEDAHLRERVEGGLSLAHAFFIDELKQLYNNAKKRQITILLFPHKKTPTVRKLAGYDPKYRKSNHVFMDAYGISTDEADIRSIAQFLIRNKEAYKRLKKFKPITQQEYQEQNQHKHNFKKEVNEDLNFARTQGYGFDKYYDYGDDDAVTHFIKHQKYELASRLVGEGIFDLGEDSTFDGEELMDAVGLHYSKSKRGELNAIQSESRLYTLVASIIRPNGDLRTREFPPGHKYEGKKMPVRWKWVKEFYLQLTPYHEKGGVAASNYKHHMRPAISNYSSKSLPISASDQEIEYFNQQKKISDKKTQEIWYILHEMIVEDDLR
tara:strand:- start:3173 stop:4279 length:1107 start_codon:yes stop_codon:yes gene_type:complete